MNDERRARGDHRAAVQPFRPAPGSLLRRVGIRAPHRRHRAGRWAPEISVGNLEARRDLTDVRDTVRAYQLILERGEPGRPYNVCSGRAIAIRDLLDRLIARARVPVAVKVDPARYRPNDTPLLLGDPARLRDELGWTPEIPIEQTLDDLLEYWRTQDTMKVLVTGGTGYLGRAVVSALAARGHDLVIFARSASRSGLPGTRDRRRHPRSRGGRARRRGLRRDLPLRGAGQHLAATAGGLRRRQRRRAAQRARAAAAALHTPRVLYTSSFVAIPPRGRTTPLRGQRLPAHEGRRRSRSPDEAVRDGAR